MTALEIPGHLSYSQISTYLKCGEAYRLEKILHAPSAPAWALAGGSAVHSGTEEWDNELMATGTAREDFDVLWAHHFAEQIEDTEKRNDIPREEWRASGRKSKDWPDKENEEWWNHHGPTFLRAWSTFRMMVPWEIWTAPDGRPGIEIDFTISIGGVLVKGAIDRIMQTREGQILPVDLKSGQAPDSYLQLGTYAKAMRDHMGVDPELGTYWMARTGSTTELHPMAKYSDAYLELLYVGARKGIEDGRFLPKESRDCSWCSVRESCFAYGGKNAAEYTPLPLTVV